MAAKKKRGCLKPLLLLLLAGLAVLWIAGEWGFNLGSNLVALSVRDSTTPLEIGSRRGVWKPLAALTPSDLNAALITRHTETGLRWSTLKIRRPSGFLGGLAQRLLGAQVHV
ncbi:MAG TPA: hypothetical protein VD994_04795, partial [Prosthecobacter sp.]|nr:hypothetical protein [Prosthecobacter sp.]